VIYSQLKGPSFVILFTKTPQASGLKVIKPGILKGSLESNVTAAGGVIIAPCKYVNELL
jgi:hypothetical protein